MPTADNRMIGFPYTKRLNAILNVDLNAAYIMMSAEHAAIARHLGRPASSTGGVATTPTKWRTFRANAPTSRRARRCNSRIVRRFTKRASASTTSTCSTSTRASRSRWRWRARCSGSTRPTQRRFTLTGGLPVRGRSGFGVHAALARRDGRPSARAAPTLGRFVTGNGMWLSKHASSVWSGRPRRRRHAALTATARYVAADEIPLPSTRGPTGPGTDRRLHGAARSCG